MPGFPDPDTEHTLSNITDEFYAVGGNIWWDRIVDTVFLEADGTILAETSLDPMKTGELVLDLSNTFTSRTEIAIDLCDDLMAVDKKDDQERVIVVQDVRYEPLATNAPFGTIIDERFRHEDAMGGY